LDSSEKRTNVADAATLAINPIIVRFAVLKPALKRTAMRNCFVMTAPNFLAGGLKIWINGTG